MKTIIKSHITHIVMLALLCVGGSAQAKVNMSSTLLKKSFFAAHPVLKWGGMSLATGAVVFAAIEGYRSYKKGENFFSLIWKDLGCGYAKARKYVYPIHDDLTAVQKEIEVTKLEIAKNEQLFASMSGYVLAGVEDTLKTLRAKLTRLEKQEARLMDRLGEKQRVATERKAKSSIKVLEGRLAKVQVEHDALMELDVRSEQQQSRLNELKGQMKNLEGLLIGYRAKRDAVSYEETVKADPVVAA